MRARASQRASVKTLAFILSCAILVITDIAFAQTTWPWAADYHHTQLAAQSKHSRVKAATVPRTPVTVQNFRAATSPEKTRLVLDLDRSTRAIERRLKNPGRVVVALPNAWLSQPARAKVADGTVPAPFRVTQIPPRSVAVSLPTASFRTYKQFALSNPPRLVIDVTPPSEQSFPSIGEVPEIPQNRNLPITQPTPPHAKGYTTIVLDPGHGGKDPGARGLRRTAEKDITLKVALQLRELLRKQPNVRVLMTRERDVFVELEDRAKFANSSEADLFVSIHVNSHPSRSVRGLEIYHFGEAKDQRALEVAARENGTPISNTGVGWEYLVADLLTAKKIEASLELAWNAKEAIVGKMNGPYEVTDHGVKTAPFYVLRFTSMPSILAEIAYISNPTEEDLLQNPTFVKDLAQSLYQGVLSFLANNK
jgi:N-acetylmuramoyl-L-alanine amidase